MKKYITLLILHFTLLVLAQQGTLDTSFNPVDKGYGSVVGADSTIWCKSIQSDGKIIIGGDFTTYNGMSRNGIARLNADGTLDISFNPFSGMVNVNINTISIQSDGKIVIGGRYNIANETTQNYITRLNSDGSFDTGFNSGIGANEFVAITSIQSDGKIVIGGEFTAYNGISRNRIARLNADGTLDASFDPGSGADLFVQITDFSIQSNGKIIIGGSFTTYNGISRNRIARLNVDGSLDTSFDPGTGATDREVATMSIQSDDKIIIGGGL